MEETKQIKKVEEVKNQNTIEKKENFFSKYRKWIIIAGILLFLISYMIGKYNNLVALNENVENKWSQVDTQYQRRMDVVNQLVSSVKGGMKQEQAIFGKIAEARSHYAGANNVSDKINAGQEMSSALSRLLVVMENYPDLKSSESVRQLMAQIEGTENRIAVTRKDFNDEVKKYNLATKRFPGSIFAKIFGFETKDYFKSVSGAEKAPEINF